MIYFRAGSPQGQVKFALGTSREEKYLAACCRVLDLELFFGGCCTNVFWTLVQQPFTCSFNYQSTT